ncbi:hypothetical protein MVI27_08615 [Chryseobacterium salipaludis]|uniref:hypothetical protein n=1 Tax=Chryseobacterium TaxID=59732 RepID=UPI001FF32419|nr:MULTISPECIES: hypothetical protein [Chryseobacterium]MCJ8498321.1 hypothetical protein [Chryseobacterium salipaludis]MCX3297433.1 hypothetical protein [Planobacterium sp. JC490]
MESAKSGDFAQHWVVREVRRICTAATLSALAIFKCKYRPATQPRWKRHPFVASRKRRGKRYSGQRDQIVKQA